MLEKNQFGKKYISFLCCVVIYAYTMFFCFFSILGVQYPPGLLGKYSIIIVGLTGSVFVFNYMKKRYVCYAELLIFVFVIFVFINMGVTNLVYGANSVAKDTIECFVARTLPAILIGMVVSYRGILKKLSKNVVWILAFFTICSTKILLLSLAKGYTGNSWATVFLLDYQNASYMAAYAFGIAMYLLFIDRVYKSKFRCILYGFALVVNAGVSVYSGGRGGVVVIAVFCILLCGYYAFVLKKASKVLKILIIFLCFFVLFGQVIARNVQFLTGFTRVFEFISSSGGINWDGTSGRLSIYTACIELIKERPIVGYGITSAPALGIERPHNIMVEILIEGGIVYFVIWVVAIVKALLFALRKSKTSYEYMLIIIIFLGDFVMLNFSSVYMRTSAMWFAMAFLITEIGKKIKKS